MNKGNIAIADEIFAPDFRLNEVTVGPNGPKQNLGGTRYAFPDIHVTIEDQIAVDDKVVTRWTVRGTHQKAYNGIPPTNKSIEVTGMVIWRIANNKIVEDWTEWNLFGLMQQLGVISAPTNS